MTLSARFLDEVENYISAARIDPTSFGRDALNDPNFVFDLRNGRSPSLRTIERVHAWIAEHPVDTDGSEPIAAAAPLVANDAA